MQVDHKSEYKALKQKSFQKTSKILHLFPSPGRSKAFLGKTQKHRLKDSTRK